MPDIPLPILVKQFLFEQERCNVIGNSMHPMLHSGQTVNILPHERALIIGHIYVFLDYGKLLMHRLVAIRKQAAVFMGDHSISIEKVDQSAIVAKLECHYNRRLVTLINFINTTCYRVSAVYFLFSFVQKFRIPCITLLTEWCSHEGKIRKT
jgi:hypothetical protein